MAIPVDIAGLVSLFPCFAVDVAHLLWTRPLTMEEIPVKLRCAACNQLANNAFRMPCCDQSICESCEHHVNCLIAYSRSADGKRPVYTSSSLSCLLA